ncbi:TPA: hypothetical protein ACPJ0Q_004659 [Vibrio diabolicus]
MKIYAKKPEQETDILTFGKPEELIEKDIENGISRFGGSMRQPSYAFAYIKSARVLLDNAIATRQLDEFGLPIFYMVRHSIELKIKDLLGLAYDVFKMKHELFNNQITLANLPSKGQFDRLERKHNIQSLYADLLGSCNKLEINVPDLLFKNVIDAIHHYEVTPTWSRYIKSDRGLHVAKEIELPIVKLVEDLEVLFKAVSYDTNGYQETVSSELYSEFNHLMSRIEDEKC